MITILVPPGSRRVGERLELDSDESHHLRVRRSELGARVRFRDGAGTGGTGQLRYEGRQAVLVVDQVEHVPAAAPLVLAVGAGDRERFAWLAEKAAELGVTEVVPLETERSLNVETRIRETQVGRIARRALEAVKQSGALWAPRVLPPVRFEQFVDAPSRGHRWILDARGDAPAALERLDGVTALVGPEGGFTDEEHALALAAGYRPVRIGSHTLRFETAAIAAAVLVQAAREGALHG